MFVSTEFSPVVVSCPGGRRDRAACCVLLGIHFLQFIADVTFIRPCFDGRFILLVFASVLVEDADLFAVAVFVNAAGGECLVDRLQSGAQMRVLLLSVRADRRRLQSFY